MVKIFVSYCWKHRKAAVVKLADELQNTFGHEIWRDETNLAGSLLEAMARGIEQADVFLLCFSSGYKASENCQKEASFASQQKKLIVPVRVEKGAEKCGGWLGRLLGERLWVDYSSDSCRAGDKALEINNQLQLLLPTGSTQEGQARSRPELREEKPQPTLKQLQKDARTLEGRNFVQNQLDQLFVLSNQHKK